MGFLKLLRQEWDSIFSTALMGAFVGLWFGILLVLFRQFRTMSRLYGPVASRARGLYDGETRPSSHADGVGVAYISYHFEVGTLCSVSVKDEAIRKQDYLSLTLSKGDFAVIRYLPEDPGHCFLEVAPRDAGRGSCHVYFAIACACWAVVFLLCLAINASPFEDRFIPPGFSVFIYLLVCVLAVAASIVFSERHGMGHPEYCTHGHDVRQVEVSMYGALSATQQGEEGALLYHDDDEDEDPRCCEKMEGREMCGQ